MKKQLMVAVMASGMVLSGCTVDPVTGQSKIDQRAAGTLLGAAAGYGVSKATKGKHAGRDAAIGAAIGAGVGYYMKKQADKLAKDMEGTGIDVELDPNTNDINIVMPGSITFDHDQTYIKPAFTGTLDTLASTMMTQSDTTFEVMGHTDSDGTDAYNYKLSENRARSVASYLVNSGISGSRINIKAYGESQPVASNSTAAGKSKNRRVEIKIYAPQEMS